MINVRVNDESFSYDIHSLIKAFYPAEDVRVLSTTGDAGSGDDTPEFLIYAGEDRIDIVICMNDKKDAGHEDVREAAPDKSSIVCHKYSFIVSRDLHENRAEYKSELKRQLYLALSDHTKRELPWGTLTGIRPTKLAMAFMEDAGRMVEDAQDPSYEIDGIIKMYMDKYLASKEKARLAVDIAIRERKVLKDIVRCAENTEKSDTHVITKAETVHPLGMTGILADGYSLYIGIPFCPSRCLYCSFMSYPIAVNKNAVATYIEAVKKEIDYVASSFAGRRLDSIYIGGGTPTTLTAEDLKGLIDYVKDRLDTGSIREFTVEAGRADSIDEDKLKTLKRLGVDRISVNPQTLNEETLKFIGRKATAAETVKAYELARHVGFDNINMDIILGLPGERLDDVRYTLDGIAKLAPDDLTVHALAVKRGSKLAELLPGSEKGGGKMIRNGHAADRADSGREENGGVTEIMLRNTELDYEKAMALTSETAAGIGLRPYYLYRQKNISGNLENTGFAAEGKEGIYNILMMEEVQDIVACGAGTVTKRVIPGIDGSVRIDRCDTHKDLKLYIENIDEMIERKRRLFG